MTENEWASHAFSILFGIVSLDGPVDAAEKIDIVMFLSDAPASVHTAAMKNIQGVFDKMDAEDAVRRMSN